MTYEPLDAIISKTDLKNMKDCQREINVWAQKHDDIMFCTYRGSLPCPYKNPRPYKEGAGYWCKNPNNEKEK